MQPQNDPSPLLSLLPLLLMTVCIAIAAHFLAKDKGRNVLKWTVLGAIPIVNLACIWFFVGAANLRLERKVDALLASLPTAGQRVPQ